MKNIKIDLVIIGGGPAGIAAGIYAAMDRVKYLLIESKEPCWFMETSVNSHDFVDGFTGVKRNCSGSSLKKSFLAHFKRLGGKISKDTVLSLTKEDNFFIIRTEGARISAKAVIITSGTSPRLLNIGVAKQFTGNIHYNCVADGSDYAGKRVAVVGGRNSGAVAACYLHDLGCSVSLIEIKSKLQAKEKYLNRLAERNIKIHTSSVVEELFGNGQLEGIKINNEGIKKIIEADALFIYIGRDALVDFLNIAIQTDEAGYLVVDTHNQTSLEGLYAAGDVTPRLKQIITACGDGANAYYFAGKYLTEHK